MAEEKLKPIPTGAPAAALVGIILLLFIFYIIFLPPEVREKILAEKAVTYEPTERELAERGLLLRASPGHLERVPEEERTHELPGVLLQEARRSLILARIAPFEIKKTWIREYTKRLPFLLEQPQNTENVLLSFQAPKHKGTLIIELNGVEVFSGRITALTPPPVELPKPLLQQQNEIVFRVEGGFFESKRYDLSDVKIVGDVREVARQLAQNVFIVQPEEHISIERAQLSFWSSCNQATIGLLEIWLNGRRVYGGVPICDSPNVVDLVRDDLVLGKNSLAFRLEEGTAQLQQLRIKLFFAEPRTFIGYFFMNESSLNRIDDGGKLKLNMTFVGNTTKQAELNINGRKFAIDQLANLYEQDITSYAVRANNFVQLTPVTSLDVASIEVWLKEP